MGKNLNDELLTRGAVKKGICGFAAREAKKTGVVSNAYTLPDIFRVIDNLPACLPAVRQAVSIKSPEQIRANEQKAEAWKNLEDFFIDRKKLFTEEEEHSVKRILELMRDLLAQEEKIFGKPSGKVGG